MKENFFLTKCNLSCTNWRQFTSYFDVNWRSSWRQNDAWRHIDVRQLTSKKVNWRQLGKLKFRINFLKNLFFSKKIFFIFFKFNKLTLKSVEANFVSKCFTFFLVKYKKLFLKKLKYQKKIEISSKNWFETLTCP